MHFGKIKIGNSFLLLVLFYFLGYTHFLGGPYWLARFYFILMLLGALFFFIFIWGILRFTKKMFQKQNDSFDKKIEEKGETIKVDATIIE